MSTQVCKIFSNAVRLQEQPGGQDHIGKHDSEMLHGEEFEIITFSEKVPGDLSTWAHGRSILDGYKGWMKDTNLVHAAVKPTHAVIRRNTNSYLHPDFKTARGDAFSFMSRLTCIPDESRNGFLKLHSLSEKRPRFMGPGGRHPSDQ